MKKTLVLPDLRRGYQMFGKYSYVAADGSGIRVSGDFMVTARKPELKEVAVSEISLLKRSLMISTRKWWVSENHGGQTVGVDHPLGKVLAIAATALMQAGKAFMTGSRPGNVSPWASSARKTRKSLIL